MRFNTSMGSVFALSALAAICGAGGCSSSSSGGPVTFACASYEPTGGSACKSCIESSACASDAVTAFGADWATNLAGGICKDTTTCLAACQCGNGGCVQTCLGQGGMACLDAEHALYVCLSENCSSPCGAAPASSDAGTDASSPTLDSGLPVTSDASDVGPSTETDASTVPVACDHTGASHYCTIRTVMASTATEFISPAPAPSRYCTIRTVMASTATGTQSMCTQQGGTIATACPTANLVGCCTIGAFVECYYPPKYNVSNASGGCTLAGGVWSTME